MKRVFKLSDIKINYDETDVVYAYAAHVIGTTDPEYVSKWYNYILHQFVNDFIPKYVFVEITDDDVAFYSKIGYTYADAVVEAINQVFTDFVNTNVLKHMNVKGKHLLEKYTYTEI